MSTAARTGACSRAGTTGSGVAKQRTRGRAAPCGAAARPTWKTSRATTGLFALTTNATVLTSDDGARWTAKKSGLKLYAKRVACPSAGRVLAFGERGDVALSTDGGKSFACALRLAWGVRDVAHAREAGLLYAVGYSSFARSIDGGGTWSTRRWERGGSLLAVHAAFRGRAGDRVDADPSQRRRRRDVVRGARGRRVPQRPRRSQARPRARPRTGSTAGERASRRATTRSRAAGPRSTRRCPRGHASFIAAAELLGEGSGPSRQSRPDPDMPMSSTRVRPPARRAPHEPGRGRVRQRLAGAVHGRARRQELDVARPFGIEHATNPCFQHLRRLREQASRSC